MAQHTFQAEADARIADVFLTILILALMLAPFVISVIANIGRRPWPSHRVPAEVRPRAMLSAPSRLTA